MPTVAMECDGCNREFEIVEVSCSFVDEDMKDAVECPYCTKAVMGRPGKIYIGDPVATETIRLPKQQLTGSSSAYK